MFQVAGSRVVFLQQRSPVIIVRLLRGHDAPAIYPIVTLGIYTAGPQRGVREADR